MTTTMEKTQTKSQIDKKDKGFLDFLAEDDSPEIGIASKEPLKEYIAGVKSEYKRIEWPTRDQVTREFLAVLVIVAIIASLIYVIDIGLDKVTSLI